MTRTRHVDVLPITMAPLELGEGARWFDKGPVQVDLLSGRLLALWDGHVQPLLDLGLPVGAAAPRAGGGLAVVAGTGVLLLRDLQDTTPIRVETDADMATLRVNDATTDDQGRLWFGLMPYDGSRGAGSMWRLDPDLTLTCVLEGVTIPNGPVMDPTGSVLYLADSARGIITSHPLDRWSGELGRGKTFVAVDDASPDGMAMDNQGGLWCALWGGSRLHRYDHRGNLTDVVPLPVSQPTSLALDPTGGPALVTSAHHGLENPGPLDGRSLWVSLDATGTPASAFGG